MWCRKSSPVETRPWKSAGSRASRPAFAPACPYLTLAVPAERLSLEEPFIAVLHELAGLSTISGPAPVRPAGAMRHLSARGGGRQRQVLAQITRRALQGAPAFGEHVGEEMPGVIAGYIIIFRDDRDISTPTYPYSSSGSLKSSQHQRHPGKSRRTPGTGRRYAAAPIVMDAECFAKGGQPSLR